ncbi:uncharacterized protein LOC127717962 [Mytilus californianus]|uniref:uncharacterized protein LOC127717962 n=1 Tax=Mytilus californianus TaxID=6549 RepID=UPI002245D839|nr:uncharacterized protein LOC127717962 [Mytilus californianus]
MDNVVFPDKNLLTIEWLLPLVIIITTFVAVTAVLLRCRKAKLEQNSSRIDDNEEDAQGNLVENGLYQSSRFFEQNNVREQVEAVSSFQRHADVGDRYLNARKPQRNTGHDVRGIISQGANAQINEINMNYAEVMFEVKHPTRHFVIHGNENRTIYSDIDQLARAEPLPSSSSESEEE